ncbi:MAG: caspase family protein [Planctomycetota bacterium]
MDPALKVVFRPVAAWHEHRSPASALLQASDPALHDNVSLAAWQHGLAGLETGDAVTTLVVPAQPVFDDMLAVWFLTCREPSEMDTDVAQTLCRYARMCRHGIPQASVPVEASPRNIAEEVLRQFPDLASEDQASAYQQRCWALFDFLEQRLVAGADLFGNELFEGPHDFQEEIALLSHDQSVYAEDLLRGEVWTGQLPQGTATRDVSLLVLEVPLSNRCADWARRDPNAPGGSGFPLLLLRWPNGEWVLTADPARRLKVGFLAAPLQAVEDQKRGRDRPPTDDTDIWYDGSRHRSTLVASPRSGTVLEREDVIAVLKEALHLVAASDATMPEAHPPQADRRSRVSPVRGPLLAAAVALLLAVLGFFFWPGEPATDTASTAPWRDAARAQRRGLSIAGEGADAPPLAEVVYERCWAVLVGIDNYVDSAIPTLEYASRDARGVEAVLRKRYGFDDATVTVLLNEEATREGILQAFGALKEKIGPDDSLLVFWAGHGTAESIGGNDEALGYLVPHDGTMERATAMSRNITMRSLRDDVLRSIRAKHQFVVLDACFGGLLAKKRSVGELTRQDQEYVLRIAKKPISYVLTAGDAQQEVLDGGYGGHSVFAGHLIRILEQVQGFATATEIGPAIRRLVADDASEHGHQQTPVFGAIRGDGDFVFLPRPLAAESSSGDSSQTGQ